MEGWKLKLNGTWNDVKGKAKKQYAALTDDRSEERRVGKEC